MACDPHTELTGEDVIIVILLLVSLASLIVGLIVSNLVWVYVAAALSAVALAGLAYGTWRRGHVVPKAPLQDTTEGEDSDAQTNASADGKTPNGQPLAVVESSSADDQTNDVTAEPVSTSVGGRTGDDILVQVVPGRKRYHLPECSLTTDEPTDDVTVGEARGEGFSPCTKCFREQAHTETSGRKPASRMSIAARQ